MLFHARKTSALLGVIVMIKGIGGQMTPFKEDVTKNIYESWVNTIADILPKNKINHTCREARLLQGLDLQELEHVKWLIEQQIEVLNKEPK